MARSSAWNVRRINSVRKNILAVKKSHTAKAILISNVRRRILYVSYAYVGAAHDFSILKTEFPPRRPWFKKFNIRLDLGFQGFAKLYACKGLYIPNKKKKGVDLTEAQKLENQAQARERVVIEHSIGGMKRYRILSDRLRCRDVDLYDELLGICAGLWNFTLKTEIVENHS